MSNEKSNVNIGKQFVHKAIKMRNGTNEMKKRQKQAKIEGPYRTRKPCGTQHPPRKGPA